MYLIASTLAENEPSEVRPIGPQRQGFRAVPEVQGSNRGNADAETRSPSGRHRRRPRFEVPLVGSWVVASSGRRVISSTLIKHHVEFNI